MRRTRPTINRTAVPSATPTSKYNPWDGGSVGDPPETQEEVTFLLFIVGRISDELRTYMGRPILETIEND